jgi:FkbM family methyltransferase
MLNFLKQKIKTALRTLGLEVHRYSSATSASARLIEALQAFNIDFVIDIGANNGQFAKDLRSAGYKKKIVSFEPLTAAHERLLSESKHDSNWLVHDRCALGNSTGQIEINIAGNSVSSSILPMLSTHSSAAPDSAYRGVEYAPISSVDIAVKPYIGQVGNPFLKIDTQGYEWYVLDGAASSLPSVKGILMELSLVPLYEGQHLWRECIDRLEAAGFVLWSLEPAFIDPATGRTLQWDGLFFRL